MNKAFFSHSSKNKGFVKETAQLFGLDFCVIDAYDFEPAYRTIDEISDKIGKSSVFVFFITRESLASEWCRDEVSKAADAIRKGSLKLFLPYIIEEGISLDEIPEWIARSECFNLKFFRSPRLLAHDIERKFRDLEHKETNKIRIRDEFFRGRNQEIDSFQTERSEKRHACTLIVAGRPGCGRHRFASRCIEEVRNLKYNIPEKINLSRGGINDLVWQLHQLTFLYSDEHVDDVLLSTEEDMVELCAEMINEIYRCNARIEITDHFCIVNYRGEIAPWFLEIIRNPILEKRLGISVISSLKPLVRYDSNEKDVIIIRLADLSNKDRKTILTGYLEAYGAEDYSDEDVEYFVGKLMQSPAQLRDTAEIIHKHGVKEARRAVADMQRRGDSKIQSLLSNFEEGSDHEQILILISILEIVSYDDLQEMYGDRYSAIESCINTLILHSLVSEFGPSGSLLRADHAVSEYLTRNNVKQTKETRRIIRKHLENVVNSSDTLGENPSRYLLKCRELMADGKFNLNEMLVPSVAMRQVIKLYNSGKNYDKVEKLCLQLLDDSLKIHLVPDFKYEVNFWLCLSLIHQGKDDHFRKRVQDAKDADFDFLQGFRARKMEDYVNAEKWYKQALKKQRAMKMARRELVDVFIHLRKYDEALILAKENYEYKRDNPFYITAYYKCLIHKRNKSYEDVDMINSLLADVERSRFPDKTQLLEGMNLLKKTFVERPKREELFNKIVELRKDFPDHQYLRGVIGECDRYIRN